MKRTRQTKQPDAILTADWHLREDNPKCRTDNFVEAQWKKVEFINQIQWAHGCPIIHSGDLFDHWKPSPALLTKTLSVLPNKFYTIYGNHDLPQHNLELAYKCGINVLQEAERLKVLNGTHWNQVTAESDLPLPENRKYLVYHVMTYKGKTPWPGCTDPKAGKLLRKYPQYDLIITGHNHQTFVEEYDGRLLVNPGSLTRQEADKTDHKPCVFLYYADTNTVEKVLLPFEEGVISREHLEVKQDRDDRIDAFVSRLNSDFQGAVSFEDNLTRMIQENEIAESVAEIIYKAVDTV